MQPESRREPWLATYLNRGTIGFWSVHAAAIAGVIWLGWSWSGIALAISLYLVRMFFVTVGYHRYFSHRSFKTSRVFQGALAFGAQTSLQRGVLWWAAKHRHHHRMSDHEGDVHSPKINGFWWAHVGWSTSALSKEVDYTKIADLVRFRELRLLDRFKHWPGVAVAMVLLLIGGSHALVWGFFVSTVLLWHGTFTINSLSHLIGHRRYATGDDSRNNWVLALITLGEGWHNNHHHYMSSANQGFRWYEIDVSYYLLLGLAAVGIVWDVRRAPAHIVRGDAARPVEARV
ncbi:MAG TPA: acyl-CoA desaturase [Kofleriaceae bacterium]|jgi:stearoyl-CoA desaturase (delta-9 desaturase)|nr:acyl-CoA desaturase [Kofleriaceae bacterium]